MVFYRILANLSLNLLLYQQSPDYLDYDSDVQICGMCRDVTNPIKNQLNSAIHPLHNFGLILLLLSSMVKKNYIMVFY